MEAVQEHMQHLLGYKSHTYRDRFERSPIIYFLIVQRAFPLIGFVSIGVCIENLKYLFQYIKLIKNYNEFTYNRIK